MIGAVLPWHDGQVAPDDLSRRLDEVHWSTDRLVAALRQPPRDDAYARQPSLLPGWSRAHVLSHLARNAEAMVRTLAGTVQGEQVPMYAGDAERDAAIETGSRLGTAELVADVARTADQLHAAWSRLTPREWEADAVTRTGPVPARRLIGARWREVEIHRVDLDDGYGPGDWPASFVAPLLPSLLDPERLGPRLPSGLAVEVVNTDSGQRWSAVGGPLGTVPAGGVTRAARAARPSSPPVRVVGPSWALVGWLTGRVPAVRRELGSPPVLKPWS